jgi:hypothetical protein
MLRILDSSSTSGLPSSLSRWATVLHAKALPFDTIAAVHNLYNQDEVASKYTPKWAYRIDSSEVKGYDELSSACILKRPVLL